MSRPDFPSDFLDRLDAAVKGRDGTPEHGEVRFRCPAEGHPDNHPSARWNRDKAVWTCDACGAGGGAFHLADLLGVEKPEGAGCSLDAYAARKRLPVAFLRSLGLTQITYQGAPAVRIPYRLADGSDGVTRYRVSLDGKPKVKTKKGGKVHLYGLDRLADARAAGEVTIVEGESDCQTAWFHGVPAVGLPGAGAWKEERDAGWLDDIATIPVVIEPDAGGEAVERWIARSRIRDRVRLVDLAPFGVKDISGLHLADPARFAERWAAAKAAAVAWTDRAATGRASDAAVAFAGAGGLLDDPALLSRVEAAITSRGYAGDVAPPMIAYVAITSRLLERPQNVAFIAQPGAGKNRAVDAARALHPEDAVYLIKAGSARALIYNEEPFEHRVVIFGEADSIPEDGPAASAVRNLATDNTMEYEVTERDEETGRFVARRIVKPGPTGLITTSTKSLGEQMGTRLLEVGIPDDAEQTRHVLRAHAAAVRRTTAVPTDPAPFVAAQQWLALAGARRVEVPFADVLAELVPTKAVRMRRDFRQLLTCVQAIALLHQRQRDAVDGWVIATLDDYAAARRLLAPVFESISREGLTPAIRATVEAVQDGEEVSLADLASRLNLAKGTASWRVNRAIGGGWLVNREERKGHPSRLARGAPLPDADSALPSLEQLREVFECSSGYRDERPPSPPSENTPEGEGQDISSQNGVEHSNTAADDEDRAGPTRSAPEPNGHRRECVECGTPLPVGWRAWYCAAHGGKHGADAPTCLDCGDPLKPGRTYRCEACTAAARSSA